jgi:hypothetical protein
VTDGRYESYYLRAVDPARPRGVWIRYTTHQRPGEPPTGSLWCTYFDDDAAEPYAVKETLPDPRRRNWIAIGESTFGPGAARGTAAGEGRSAAWDLTVSGEEEPLRHLPREWMYRTRLPRTKLESPLPAARFDGLLEIGGERVAVDGWPGMVGHNWGAEHAATWVWLHGIELGEGAWLDLSAGRVRAGPLLTPWIANGALHVDGRRFRLGGPRPAKVVATPAACRVVVPGAVIEAIPRRQVAWRYADPTGGEHHSLNSSIAELRVVLDDGRELATGHCGVYELGTTDTSHGVPVQPFSDG